MVCMVCTITPRFVPYHMVCTLEVQTNKYATHFTCTVDNGNKRKMTPWMLEKCIQQQIDRRPISIRSGGRNSYIIEVDSEEQSKKVMNITQINNIKVDIAENQYINSSKGRYMYMTMT